MKTVHKYTLRNLGLNIISMPRDSRVVHVAEQDIFLSLWAEVETYNQEEPRSFIVLGAGQTLPDNGKYAGTAVMSNGLVWHVYEQL